jgi:hypothetical protein
MPLVDDLFRRESALAKSPPERLSYERRIRALEN